MTLSSSLRKEMNKKMKEEGYFPLLIQYVNSNETVVVNTPQEITSGKTFIVLETNYEE